MKFRLLSRAPRAFVSPRPQVMMTQAWLPHNRAFFTRSLCCPLIGFPLFSFRCSKDVFRTLAHRTVANSLRNAVRAYFLHASRFVVCSSPFLSVNQLMLRFRWLRIDDKRLGTHPAQRISSWRRFSTFAIIAFCALPALSPGLWKALRARAEARFHENMRLARMRFQPSDSAFFLALVI